MAAEHRTQLLEQEKGTDTPDDIAEPVSYSGRWMIVWNASLVACTQGAIWSIPGAIQPTLQAVYGFDGNTIQLLLNYGPLGWFVTCFYFSWHMDRYGCRFSVLAAIWLVFISCILRVLAWDDSPLSIALVHISFVLNAFAGPVAMCACSKLSEAWFSKEDRTVATAVMAEANNCAGILMWLLVPVLCQDQDLKSLMNLNYVFLAITGLNVITGMAYFPSHPPTPPSASAVLVKNAQEDFTPKALMSSLWALTWHKSYMTIGMSYAVIAGMANSLSGLLVAILSNIGYSQTQSGWIGFASSCMGMAAGIWLARFTDKRRNQRQMLLWFLALSGITYLVFAVAAQGWLPQTFIQSTGGFLLVGAAFTACNVLFDASIPLFYELAVESTYPIPEATALMYMVTAMNAATGIVLAAPMDSVGITWLPWAMGGITLLCVVVIAAAFADKSPRYDYDATHTTEDAEKDNMESVKGWVAEKEKEGSSSSEVVMGGAGENDEEEGGGLLKRGGKGGKKKSGGRSSFSLNGR